MNDDELLRYSRHILLPEIGVEGQERLLASRALVIGAGGLGSPVALYLAGGGVGEITLVDPDTVDVTNLQRQIVHGQDTVGWPKVESARQRMLQMNPLSRIHTLQERVDAPRLDALVAQADVVLDCSDNFSTRQAVNAACVAHGVALVSGAAIGMDGQLSVYDTRRADNPLKLLAGVGRSLAGRLQMFDARTLEWTEIRIGRRADCEVCAMHRA